MTTTLGGQGEHRKSNYDLHSDAKKTDKSKYSQGVRGIDYTDQLFQDNMQYIVKIQAAYRGHLSRKLTSMMRSKQIGSSKYFTYEESKETISKRPFNPHQQRETRPPY